MINPLGTLFYPVNGGSSRTKTSPFKIWVILSIQVGMLFGMFFHKTLLEQPHFISTKILCPMIQGYGLSLQQEILLSAHGESTWLLLINPFHTLSFGLPSFPPKFLYSCGRSSMEFYPLIEESSRVEYLCVLNTYAFQMLRFSQQLTFSCIASCQLPLGLYLSP